MAVLSEGTIENRPAPAELESAALSGYRLKISTDLTDSVWDEFVGSHPDGHHEQTSSWSHVKWLSGHWRATRFYYERDGQIVGGAQLLHKKVGGMLKIGYIRKGPLTAMGDRSLSDGICATVQRLGNVLGCTYLVVDLPYEGQDMGESFDRLGFRPHPSRLHPQNLMSGTVTLDLRPSLDTLLSQMRTTTRQSIRRGLRDGVSVWAGGEEHLNLFWNLMSDLCKRRGVSPSPSEPNFFHHLWDVFGGGKKLRFLFASYNGEVVSGMLLFMFGSWVRCWKVGWSGKHGKVFPNEALWWEAIKWSKEAGYSCFDFVWVDRACAEALAAGHAMPDSKWAGVCFFKLGFGGKVKLLPTPRLFIYNAFFRVFANFGGLKLLDVPMSGRDGGRG